MEDQCVVLSTSRVKCIVNCSVFLRDTMASSASKKKDKRTTLADFDLTTTLGEHNLKKKKPFATLFAILRIALL